MVEHRPDGFVEFRFAIGDPELFVEMHLTEAAYAEFCESTGAEMLAPVDLLADVDDWAWTLHDAAHRRPSDSATDAVPEPGAGRKER